MIDIDAVEQRLGAEALALPGPCSPSGHGLGRSGGITTRMLPDSDFDCDLPSDWLIESYRAVAPKRLVAELDARGEGGAGAPCGRLQRRARQAAASFSARRAEAMPK